MLIALSGYDEKKIKDKDRHVCILEVPQHLYVHNSTRTNVPFTWGKLCIRAQYPSKAEAVGISSYMVQLKEGITLTAQKNRDMILVES
ncbi:hypothetical protein CR513_40682, partial [Mucuna pruriens]